MRRFWRWRGETRDTGGPPEQEGVLEKNLLTVDQQQTADQETQEAAYEAYREELQFTGVMALVRQRASALPD